MLVRQVPQLFCSLQHIEIKIKRGFLCHCILFCFMLSIHLFCCEISLWVGQHLIANHELLHSGGPSKVYRVGRY